MRILLADDQPRVRFALRVLLERQQGFEVVAEAADVEDLLTQTETNRPDIVLLGWEMPNLQALGSLARLRAIHPKLLVVVMSAMPEAHQAAVRFGADGFVSKADPPERLLAAIDQCCRGSSAIGDQDSITSREGDEQG